MAAELGLGRDRSARSVSAALRTNGPAAANARAAMRAPFLVEGEGRPDTALLLALFARLLDDRTGAMVNADLEHTKQLGERGKAIEEREALLEAIQEELGEDRDIIGGLYKPSVAQELGFAFANTRDGAVLKNRLKAIVAKLPAAKLGTSRVPPAPCPARGSGWEAPSRRWPSGRCGHRGDARTGGAAAPCRASPPLPPGRVGASRRVRWRRWGRWCAGTRRRNGRFFHDPAPFWMPWFLLEVGIVVGDQGDHSAGGAVDQGGLRVGWGVGTMRGHG